MRWFGAQIGKNCVIHNLSVSNLYRMGLRGLTIGDECFIGEEVFLDLADRIHLGDQVTFAARAVILTHLNVGYHDHPLQERFPASHAGVEIGSGAFIGAGATVLPGVRIGRRALVGAGAVVTADVPDGAVAVGIPARIAGNSSFAPTHSQ